LIELLIAAGLGALVAHAKNQTFEGKIELLQRDFQNGKLTPEQAKEQYQKIVSSEIEKIPADGVSTPPNVKEAFKQGLDYKTLADKVDPDTYNYIEALYWNGDWR
jgi:hypothetical protein